MRDPKRIPRILKLLEKIWLEYPDFRLGQLIENAVPSPLYYVEDDEMEQKIKAMYSSLKNS